MKVYLDTVGCRLNQSEIETFARQFRGAGHTLVSQAAEADLVVINTCTVTAAAASDSRQKIRQAARAGAGRVVATGCWATLEPGSAASLSAVSHVISNTHKDNLVSELLQIPQETFDLEPLEREPLPGARGRTRAFIKAQDGCDNRCTFCITTVARGPGRSRTTQEVLGDIHAALANREGAQEIVITGVHLGSWGQDLEPASGLYSLVQAILQETDAPRVRLSSLEPWQLNREFFELWENPRLCRHLHLPLQSGSAATLRRMARKTTPGEFSALVSEAREMIPGLAVTTDIIVGFPGEDEQEFAQSLAFVQAMNFAGGHVFTYSARAGTAAARMPHQVPHRMRKIHSAQMREAIAQSSLAYRRSHVGQTLPVLWESATSLGPDSWDMQGLTDNYLRINTHAPRHLWNTITAVKLTGLTEEGLLGEIYPEK
jgi:threonylcarbamoyladenosine tRNA methylthiotransferase MtaB